MIRRVIIVLLSIASIGSFALWAMSYVAPQHMATISVAVARVWNLRDGRVCFFEERNSRLYVDWDTKLERSYHLPRLVRVLTYSLASKSGYQRLEVIVQIGPFALLFGIYPTIAFICGPLRRIRRRKRGLCPWCGYDLTGNTSGVCPECAAKIDEEAKAPRKESPS